MRGKQVNLFEEAICPMVQFFVELMCACAKFDALSYKKGYETASVFGDSFGHWIDHKWGKKGYYEKSIFVLIACGADKTHFRLIAQMLGVENNPWMGESKALWRRELGQKFYNRTLSSANEPWIEREQLLKFLKNNRIDDGGNGHNWTRFAVVAVEKGTPTENYKTLFDL
jgi:hypothetical protein